MSSMMQLNNRITQLALEINKNNTGDVKLDGNNIWTGYNSYTKIVECPINATTNNQLCNYQTVVSLVAGGGTSILQSNNLWTGNNDFNKPISLIGSDSTTIDISCSNNKLSLSSDALPVSSLTISQYAFPIVLNGITYYLPLYTL
jgi:hypothetical protein